MNPHVHYMTEGSRARVSGVAISLKEFLCAVEVYNIEADEEKEIRQKLRGHPRAATRKKQYFNIASSKKNKIDRTEGGVRCMTCVCVPADEIPEVFFRIIEDAQDAGKSSIHTHTPIITSTNNYY